MLNWYLKRRRLLQIRPLKQEITTDGTCRIGWQVNGSPLWFESRDLRPEANPEAIACLSFSAAALKGYRVKFPEPVCPTLLGNLSELEIIWHDWWDTSIGRFTAKPHQNHLLSPGPGIGCFLSLGADSFHSVLRNPDIDTVIYVGGYDVPIADTARLDRIEQHFRSAAEQIGKRAIFLRSNLRVHPEFRRLHWERSHGAALAAAAHVLRPALGKAFISSSFPVHLFKPWGTSWKTDQLWSSSAVSLEHTGHDLTRFQKIAEIVGHPAFHAHLHVCWEHRNGNYNCGQCEKCRRTMIGLLSLGHLEKFPTLPGQAGLIESLKNAEPLVPHIFPTYRSFIENGLPESVAAEVADLLRRSGDT